MITLIAACSSNRVIGKDNRLIWHIPGDLKRFKEITSGHTILMGRKTFESIGKPLPNRKNIVLTRDKDWKAEGVTTIIDIKDIKDEDLFIIGGGEIYRMFIDISDKIELTLIDKEFEGDTYFPNIGNEWIEQKRETLNCPEFTYHYITYTRK